jgi:hypothetical protein
MASSPDASATPACGSLITCPLSVSGDYRAPAEAVLKVAHAIRAACLRDLRLCPGEQPSALEVRNVPGVTPAIWLHTEAPETAIIIVDIGEAAWCQFAYQLGHELGHVACNSWRWGDRPVPPSQWIEESVAEAFSLASMQALAENWRREPPFAGDNAYADTISAYADEQVARYRSVDLAPGQDWRDVTGGRKKWSEALIVRLVAAIRERPARCEALAAMNLWPERGGVPPQDFAARWRSSCRQNGLAADLPDVLRSWMDDVSAS